MPSMSTEMKIRTVMAAKGIAPNCLVRACHARDMRIVHLVVAALTLVACGPIDGTTTADRPISAPGTREETTVTRVVDGDTIHVSLGSDDATIRLIGIDTPETVAPGQPVECF